VRGLSADQMRAIKEQCWEMKTTSNTVSEDTLKLKTRLMGVERELVKRDRVLRQMIQLNQAGQGISMDVIEKLREERGLATLYKRKLQDLIGNIEEKDTEVRQLKRDKHFTDIIELQVEYASWQHEAERLGSLLEEPSVELSDVAKQEVDVMREYVDELQMALKVAQKKKEEVQAELVEVEVQHKEAERQHRVRQEELTQEQDATRKVASEFKEQLLQRKSMEQMEDEIDQMELELRRCDDEIRRFRQLAEDGDSQRLPRTAVSEDALEGKPLASVPKEALECLWCLRRAEGELWGQDSLLVRLLKQDLDADGLLDAAQLSVALQGTACPLSAAEAANLIQALPKCVAPLFSGVRSIRWLDLLVLLERLPGGAGAPAVSAPASLPAVRPLRAACLRSKISREEVRERLQAATSRSQAVEAFLHFGLEERLAGVWANFWQAYGPTQLMLQLPYGEVAPTADGRKAWFHRCKDAVDAHRAELEQAFGDNPPATGKQLNLWTDYKLTEEQFKLVCNDILATKLLSTDIHDLYLLLCEGRAGDGIIDCRAVLQLADELS